MIPTIGVHPDVPAETYHKWDAASASRLKVFARSPAHMREAVDHPKDPTPALILGDAAHYCALQPALFATRFAAAPACDRRTKDGKAAYQAFLESNPGKRPLAQDDFDACRRMADAVYAHRAARELLEARTATELSAVWRCPETDVLCKLRADALTVMNGYPVVADLKTTDDASREAFERSVWQYRYFCQAAHYTGGLASLDMIYDDFCVIAVEKAPPHAVAVYRITDDVMAVGREEVLKQLRGYARCVESGVWPAYPDEIQDLGIPAWGLRQLEQVA